MASPEKAAFLPRFFKTGPGEYGEGDIFLGVTVPEIRSIAKKYHDMPLSDVVKLLHDEHHECRFCALCIMTYCYPKMPEIITSTYLENTQYVNNWDLVDLSANKIIGAYCRTSNNNDIVYKLSSSPDLWEKRISIVACLEYYRHGELGPGLEIIQKHLFDSHDLIQKANGWMLREIYKCVDEKIVEEFLVGNYKKVPRTTLRYAIERMPESKRQQFLKGNFS